MTIRFGNGINANITSDFTTRGVGVTFKGNQLCVELDDGREISVPLGWYPRLVHATAGERDDWRRTGGGEGFHWPAIEEDISVESLLRGRRSQEGAASFAKWLALRRS